MRVELSRHVNAPAALPRSGAGNRRVSPGAFATLQNMSLLEWALLMRDSSYQLTALGPSVDEFLTYMKLGGKADRTIEQYRHDLARGCLLYPEVSLKEWGDTEMLHLAASFKDKERRTRVAAWRSFFRWALKQGLVERNPCDRLPEMKAQPQRFIDVFSDEEIAVLTALPVRDSALMQVLFDGGLRKSEAINFKLLHLRGSELVILNGKGSKDRVVPASSEVVQAVNELALLEGLDEPDYLWYCRPGGGQVISRRRPIVDSAFARWWRRCLEEAGVPYRNPHVARHTFATRWLRKGGRLDLLSMAMGHASIKTTHDLYSHLDTTDLAAEFDLLFPGEQTRTDEPRNQTGLNI